MKKALALLVMCFMALGASLVYADSRTDAMNVDSRFVDDLDLIWLYPNMANDYKNTVDFRTYYLDHDYEWGGLLDGEHSDLGTLGAYVNRPVGYDGTRNWNYHTDTGWWGVGSGWSGSSWNNYYNWYFPYGNGGASWAYTTPTPENKVDLFWANKWDTTSFGIQLNYADSMGDDYQDKDTGGTPYSDNEQYGSRVIGINLGLGLTDGTFFNQANFHAGFSLGSANVLYNYTEGGAVWENDTIKDNGIYTLSFGTLLQHDLDQNSNMRFFADVYIDQNNQTMVLNYDNGGDGLHNDGGDYDETWTEKYNDIIATVGFGCNHKVLDGKATISSGLLASWASANWKTAGSTQNFGAASASVYDVGYDEYADDVWTLNWNVSVEAHVTSWLDVRAGMNRPIINRWGDWYRDDYAYVGNAPTQSYKYTETYDDYAGSDDSTYAMGFGIHWENWELNAVANVQSVFDSIGNVAPGNGIFVDNGTNSGSIVTNWDADIRYRF